MLIRNLRRNALRRTLTMTLALTLVLLPLAAQAQSGSVRPEAQEKSRPRRTVPPPPTTSPTTPASEQIENIEQQADGAAIDDDEVISVETNLTNVLFTAADKNRRYITNLTKDDVRILEDGVPQEIFTFQQQVDLPLSIAFVMDISRSQAFTLPEQRAAANAFIDSVLRPKRDEAAVVSFAGDVFLEQGLTANMTLLHRAVERVKYVPPSGFFVDGNPIPGTPPIADPSRSQTLANTTALWDAVWVTSKDVLEPSSPNTRRAIILLTDGVDKSSDVKLSEAVERAVKAEAVIFSIGIAGFVDGDYNHIDQGVLRKVSERTGGRAYFPKDDNELREAFAQIQRELREQYLIAYSPKNKKRDGAFRKIEIEVVNPELRKQKPRLTYRQGYFAKGSAASSTATRRR